MPNPITPPTDPQQIDIQPQASIAPKQVEISEDPRAKATIDAFKDEGQKDIKETVGKIPSLKESLTEQLKGAAKVETPAWVPEEVEKDGRQILTITIEDKEKFLEDGPMRAMEPLLGRLVYNTFQQRGEEEPEYPGKDQESKDALIDEYFRDGDLASADKIHLLLEGDKVAGFYFLKYRTLEGGQKVCHILLTMMDKPFKGTTGHRQLTQTVFRNEKEADAFSAITHTPAFVKSMQRVAPQEGMDVYFGGERVTNREKPLTALEQRMLKTVRKGDIDAMVEEYGFGEHQEGLPEEYVSYGPAIGEDGEVLSIPPRKKEEVLLREDDPLRGAFMKLIDTADAKKPRHAVYGTVLIPKHPEKF